MSGIDDCLRALPKTLKIGAYDWTVVCLDGADEHCAVAVWQISQFQLWPENITSPGHAVGCVLHECLHVIFANHGLEKMKRNKSDREEAIILGFEEGLISLFRDNPKLVTWMKKWLK